MKNKVIFNSEEEFIHTFAGMPSAGIYAKADFIEYVFTTLLSDYDYNCGFVNFTNGIYDEEYGREYVLTIDDCNTVSVEHAWLGDNIISAMSDVIFVHDTDVSRELIDRLDDEIILFNVGNPMCDGDCENCTLHMEETIDDKIEQATGKFRELLNECAELFYNI